MSVIPAVLPPVPDEEVPEEAIDVLDPFDVLDAEA
jgi:hypothetical protein